MQTACLYIRVSTDEQAIRGFSQRSQEERLKKYCSIQNIQVLNTVFEDFSAKTFDRPAWSQFLTDLKRHKDQRPNLILFTKWDRFSRNAADAYYMIRQLENWGIQVQAIEQSLDLTIPENKIMLAVYIAVAEAENDRRAINIKQNIYKAKQEGRWTAHAPLGYINKSNELGQKYIAPQEPEASFIRNIFQLIVENTSSTTQIYKQVTTEGLKCSKTNFWNIIRNPVYCGKVRITAAGLTKNIVVQGQHEAIISEGLFNQVQQVLSARGRKETPSRRKLNEQFPLRGFLLCPNCNRHLMGSTSKGRSQRYPYYHCRPPCRYRVRADLINQSFLDVLKRLIPNSPYIKLYKATLQGIYGETGLTQQVTHQSLTKHIDAFINRIVKARELLFTGEIDHGDYLAIKSNCESKINSIGAQIQKAALIYKNANGKVGKALNSLKCLGTFYESVSVSIKNKLIELLLPSQFVFNKETITGLFNDPVKIIYNLPVPISHAPGTTSGYCSDIEMPYRDFFSSIAALEERPLIACSSVLTLI